MLRVLALALLTSTSAFAVESDCAGKPSISADELILCTKVDNAYEHLKAFQAIADANNNNRATGTEGYKQSAYYVAGKLVKAGYTVKLWPFKFDKYSKISSAFSQGATQYVEGTDYNVLSYSASGTANAEVVAVDLSLGTGNQSTSGCEATDFVNFPKGKIALIQRGTCAFKDKAENAQAAGASAVIIFNQGNSDDRKDLFQGTLSNEAKLKIPALAITYDLGVALQNSTVDVAAETKVEMMTSFNVIADHPSGDANSIVMLGAHLDGVEDGPGINDNGSGSAGILEVALQMKDVQTKNKLRFAWWGAEELGLVGSTKYVLAMSEEDKAKTKLYLNFDMIASPNYVLGVFDADGSKFGQKAPKGSNTVELQLQMFFQAMGTQATEIEFSGRSDYASFADAGIPVGGLATGAEGIKTEEEAKLYGGQAGVAYDPNYHSPNDTLANVSISALEINTHAIAFMALKYAHSVDDIEKEKSEATESLLRLARP